MLNHSQLRVTSLALVIHTDVSHSTNSISLLEMHLCLALPVNLECINIFVKVDLATGFKWVSQSIRVLIVELTDADLLFAGSPIQLKL